jgi:hypothetical protein
MMNDILSENVRDLNSRVTGTGKAIGERVHSAAAATASAAGQAQKMVQDATEATVAGVDQAKKVLGDASDAAQQAWSQAGEVAEDVFDAGLRASRSVSRQMHENPLIAVLVGIALGCIASLWFRSGGSTATAPSPKRSRVATPPKKAAPR